MNEPTSNELEWLVSVDDHVLEPPTLWQERVDRKYRDDAPVIVKDEGSEYWAFAGKKISDARPWSSSGVVP